jgi:hypothetical protein
MPVSNSEMDKLFPDSDSPRPTEEQFNEYYRRVRESVSKKPFSDAYNAVISEAERKAMEDLKERLRWAEVIAKHLCESWGWLEGEPEAVTLGVNIAFNLEVLTANTRTSPEALLQALLPMERQAELKAPTQSDYILKG